MQGDKIELGMQRVKVKPGTQGVKDGLTESPVMEVVEGDEEAGDEHQTHCQQHEADSPRLGVVQVLQWGGGGGRGGERQSTCPLETVKNHQVYCLMPSNNF